MTAGSVLAVLAVTGGVVVLAATAVDIIRTVFGASMGGGALSRWAMGGVGAVAARLRPRRRVLVWTGPLLTAAATPGWLALLWLGWGLVFQPAGSVITTSGQPAGSWQRAYFAGYSLTTLGNGEFQPAGAGWQAMTVVTSASGFIVITAGLGYLIAMISAAIQRHTTAARVHALGATPTEMCLASWNGRDLHRVDAELRELNSAVTQIAQQHLAYPALRHFHATSRVNALAPSLAALDEALTLLHCGVAPGIGPDGLTVAQTRSAIDGFLGLAQPRQSRSAATPPPPPDLAPLRAAGIPVVGEAELHSAVARLADRRVALRALVEDDGWSWADVTGGS